jgi:hypothetical protein
MSGEPGWWRNAETVRYSIRVRSQKRAAASSISICPSPAFLLRFLGLLGLLYFILFFNFCIARTYDHFYKLAFLFALSTARRMVGIITLTVLGAGLTILKLGIDLRRNIEKAKSTGLPYIVGREFDLSSFSYNFLVLIMMARL